MRREARIAVSATISSTIWYPLGASALTRPKCKEIAKTMLNAGQKRCNCHSLCHTWNGRVRLERRSCNTIDWARENPIESWPNSDSGRKTPQKCRRSNQYWKRMTRKHIFSRRCKKVSMGWPQLGMVNNLGSSPIQYQSTERHQRTGRMERERYISHGWNLWETIRQIWFIWYAQDQLCSYTSKGTYTVGRNGSNWRSNSDTCLQLSTNRLLQQGCIRLAKLQGCTFCN